MYSVFLYIFIDTFNTSFWTCLLQNVPSINRIFESLTLILSNLNNFHSLEVVERVSETPRQVAENSN